VAGYLDVGLVSFALAWSGLNVWTWREEQAAGPVII
jgi:hypothetical protein